ncbi:hypothetical protein D9M68_887550 [compost metagenome]
MGHLLGGGCCLFSLPLLAACSIPADLAGFQQLAGRRMQLIDALDDPLDQVAQPEAHGAHRLAQLPELILAFSGNHLAKVP